MKITFVLSIADLSGGVRVVAIYAQKLKERGHEVVVISRPPRQPTFREKLRAKIKGKSLPSAARNTSSHFDSTGIDHRVIDAHRPITPGDVPDSDVIIATWWETAQWIANFPASKGAKVYFIQHYEAHANQPAEQVDATWRLPMAKIAVAQWLADLGRDKLGAPDVVVVPNSVDQSQFFAPIRGKQQRPTIGLMYSHVHFKGVDIALTAIELARTKHPDLRVIAFGNREPAESLPLPPNSEFVLRPDQDKIREIYARADAWLFASRSEGFGLPILEAMACRTPVIATPAGAAPELLSDGAGILVPPENPRGMAEGIGHVIEMTDPDWRRLSDHVYRTISRYTWENATDRFEEQLKAEAARHGQS